MCSRSRTVAECSTSCTGSIRNLRSNALDARSKTWISQPNTVRYAVVDPARRNAVDSGRAIARFFGNSSPNSICTNVENSNASTVPTAMPAAAGTPNPPRPLPSASPISGSAT